MKFKRLQEQAYDHLRDMVLRGEFAPGVIYSETKTAESLGISRTPTRDALQKLSHDGLVDIMPSKGFRLHQSTRRDALEIHQMRCAIEGYCVRLLAQRIDEPDVRRLLSELAALIDRQRTVMNNGDEVKSFVSLDFSFHMRIINFAQNDVFTETFQNQLYRIGMVATTALTTPERMRQSLEEHARLLDVINSGRPDAAYAALLTHYQNLVEMISATCVEE